MGSALLQSRRVFFELLLIGMSSLSLLKAAPELSDNSPQKQKEAELLSLPREERRAHFEQDMNFLLAHVVPQLLDVRDGRVNRMSRGDVRDKFVQYLKGAQLSAWGDVEPPIVRVSADGNMGWMIVRVRIAYTETDASGKKTQREYRRSMDISLRKTKRHMDHDGSDI